MVKAAHVPEPSSEAREVAPVEAPQTPVGKADTSASPVASLQTASEQLSSAFTSFAQRKPAEVSAAQPAEKSATQPAEKSAENMRSKVAPEKKEAPENSSICTQKHSCGEASSQSSRSRTRAAPFSPGECGKKKARAGSVVAIFGTCGTLDCSG